MLRLWRVSCTGAVAAVVRRVPPMSRDEPLNNKGRTAEGIKERYTERRIMKPNVPAKLIILLDNDPRAPISSFPGSTRVQAELRQRRQSYQRTQ